MRYFLTVSLSTIAVVLLASLLSWQVHQLFNLNELLAFPKFAKVSIILLIILLSLFLARRWNSPYKNIFGLTPPVGTRQTQSFFIFLGSGILIVIPLAIIFAVLEVRTIDEKKLVASIILFNIVKYSLTALLIAGIEEIFFRGILIYGLLKQKVTAILLSAAFFTALHFIAFAPDSQYLANAPWYYGIQSLYYGIGLKYTLESALSPAVALFLAGVFLALVRISTRWIIPCIGIHCGWIIGVKLYKKLTDLNSDSEFIYLIGDYDRFIGWGSAIWFGLLIVWWLLRNKQT